ncbi:glycosyltransferase family 2 protein [Synechococcus sp. NB0720_010]|uniref:glycosyltransferase family 2 protein n=1 Tax=Synechococcus sp. NB0720_010 TaxID=2907159 RepID=UPI00352FFEB3
MAYSNGHTSKVTIGMPVCNGEKTIRYTIENVINQTYQSWKLIISDNYSSDRTTQIIQDYARRDTRIITTSPSKPLTAEENFRYVLSLSTSTYFCWLACDDYWTNNTVLESWVRVLDNNSKYLTVFSQAKNVNYVDQTVFESPHPPIFNSPSSHDLLRGVYRLYLMNPSIIYGLHRRASLDYINDVTFTYDYSDCAFVLNQEIKGGIAILPSIDFAIGTIGYKRIVKTTGKRLSRAPYVKKVIRMLASQGTILSFFALLLSAPAIVLFYYHSIVTEFTSIK